MCSFFITPDTHTVWESITPNDNKRNMAKCEGLNLCRFQTPLVLLFMGLNGSTHDAGPTCDVKGIEAWRLENVALFFKYSRIPKRLPFVPFTYRHLPLNITLKVKRCFWTKCLMNPLGLGWARGVLK